MLSIISFLALVTYSLLMVFNVLNPILHLKYLIVLVSILFTLLSLGLFISNNEVRKISYFLFVIALILPASIPLIGLMAVEMYSDYWKLFIGGTIFQIGTGIYSILGGLMKGPLTPIKRFLVLFNYFLFTIMAFNSIFNANVLSQDMHYIVIGVIASVLSLILLLFKKPNLSVLK
ncbi:hypothetical protein [Brumimicrobium mesophilum]|uniref:hypothetical protein n=1 Tax=Brumimicrobium mesophilum TaxID=392717 RepID=UPI00131DF0C7|nr:hypothetical protein [Brumimicrobium mesophilum]